MMNRQLLLSLVAAALLAPAPNAPGAEPNRSPFITDLGSDKWFVFGRPDGKVEAAFEYILIKATTGFGSGGHVGAIWRQRVNRPAKGTQYLYVWQIKERSSLRPGRSHIVLKPRGQTLSPLDKDDYFGAYIGVSPSRRRYVRLIRNGQLEGYHHLPRLGDVDLRFALTASKIGLEIKLSMQDEWMRLPANDNPWKDATHDTLFLHLESHGDPNDKESSDYGVHGVELRQDDVAHPIVGSAAPPPKPLKSKGAAAKAVEEAKDAKADRNTRKARRAARKAAKETTPKQREEQ